MARIPYADTGNISERVRAALAGRRRINIFRMIANADNCAPEVLALGSRMSRGSSLPPVERELVILRVAHLTGAAYQWHEHLTVAARVGVEARTVEVLAAYPDGPAEQLTPRERTLIDFTDSVVRTTTASQDLFDTARVGYTDSQLVELVLLIGFYMMVGRVMNTFEIELETDDSGVFEAAEPGRGENNR